MSDSRQARKIAALGVMLVLGTPAVSCEQTVEPPVEQPKEETPTYPVGLAAIKKRGVLRFLTRNNGHTYFVVRGKRMGFDYEMAKLFAERLGVKLEVLVPPNWGDLIINLEKGEGDVIGAGMTVTEARTEHVTFARPYALTHTRVVWAKGTRPIESPEDLSGKQVHVRRYSAYYELIEELNALFDQAGMRPIDVIIEAETMETEQILEDVAAGKVPYTLCDNHLCRMNKHYLPDLELGPPVGGPRPLAWAVHKDADDLLAEVNAFFQEEHRHRLPEVLQRYYEAPRSQAARRREGSLVDRSGRISPFDEALRKAGGEHGIDWRLLASLAYQESRFNPNGKTWTGGRGLFGMLPDTAQTLGIKPKQLVEPRHAAIAAAKQLAQMRSKFAMLPSDEERLKMALAAYHVGPEHITDARILASQKSLNPDVWRDIAKVLPLLAQKTYASRAEHGYVRGAETVTYVEETWDRYRAYRHSSGARD